MPRISVVGQGSIKQDGKPTLRKLEVGETFRFLNSAPGVIYQKLNGSDRARYEGCFGHDYDHLYSNILTGQVFGDFVDLEVVPVTCSMTVSEKK
jgi:hypothetical protein